MDKLSRERRSWNMSRIQGKNTLPEILVRSLLHRLGYRFRLHRRDLPGRPDIVLSRYCTVIFVHGCFWHRHKSCKQASTPKTNRAFWEDKFQKNVARDVRNDELLKKKGWKTLLVWECETRDEDALARKINRVLRSAGKRQINK